MTAPVDALRTTPLILPAFVGMGFITKFATIVSPIRVFTFVETLVYPTFWAVMVNSPTPVPRKKNEPVNESLKTEEVDGLVVKTAKEIGRPVDASKTFPEIAVLLTACKESSLTPLVGPVEESEQEERSTSVTENSQNESM